jgi:hypothetical protein
MARGFSPASLSDVAKAAATADGADDSLADLSALWAR